MEGAMRIIGMNVSRAFAELVAWEEGRLRRLGRVDMRRDLFEAWARKLRPDDVVVIEATGNAVGAVEVMSPSCVAAKLLGDRCAGGRVPASRCFHQHPHTASSISFATDGF
jgi:hypothetical protein